MSDLDRQFDAVLDDAASDAELAAVRDAVATDPDALRRWIECSILHANLCENLRYVVDAPIVTEADPAVRLTRTAGDRARIIRGRSPKWVRPLLGIAAAILIGVLSVAIYRTETQVAPDAGHEPPAGAPLGRLTWTDAPIEADEAIVTGGSFGPQTIRTRAGNAEFVLSSGAKVQLRGPSELDIQSPMSATLKSGSASFYCPPSAKGYVVGLPNGARVIDLGTRFDASVSAGGDVTLNVTEGTILLEHGGGSRRVAAGQWVVLSGDRVRSGLITRRPIVAHWRFEPTGEGVAMNAASPGQHDALPPGRLTLSNHTPGARIFDPITGNTHENRSSYSMSGGRLRVSDSQAFTAPQFTVEAFVRIRTDLEYQSMIGRMLLDRAGWQLDMDLSFNLRARADTAPTPARRRNQLTRPTETRPLDDGRWHHVALTFDGAVFRIYTDYTHVGTLKVRGDIGSMLHADASLTLGFWSDSSWIDEARYCDRVLDTREFLRVADGPENPDTLSPAP